MLLFREKIPGDWLPKVLGNLPAVLVDHAHLERKAATTALNLEKYRDLYGRLGELNAIAIEELQHFQLVLALLEKRGKREVPIAADFVGFVCPDDFVVGYGMDVAHSYRELPYIGHVVTEADRP